LRYNQPFFSDKEFKEILDYVQKDAEKHPSRTKKTTELMVLILALGLDGAELLRLNIADLPCHHGKNSIIVHTSRGKGTTREVYLYDGLETKIKEYYQEYRQGAKSSDRFFITLRDKPVDYRTLSYKLFVISGKLGIKPLTPAMFRRTLIYQVAGETDRELKKRTKSKATLVSLKNFISKCCKGNYSEAELTDLVTLIYNANAREAITLPKHRGPWKSGQSKKYYMLELVMNWSKYQDKLPALPDLDYQKINKRLKAN
jgi:hypothetical protein